MFRGCLLVSMSVSGDYICVSGVFILKCCLGECDYFDENVSEF